MDTEAMTRHEELIKMLNEIKLENAILRKEILGIKHDCSSPSTGLIECKTLREIVEETQFHVKAINAKILKDLNQKIIQGNPKSKEGLKTEVGDESDSSISEESAELEEYPVVEIRSKTLEEERKWMKQDFGDLMKIERMQDGESLRGTTIQANTNSFCESKNVVFSCTVKLSNGLDTVITNPKYFVPRGIITAEGPSKVMGYTSEVFCFGVYRITYCDVMCSFAVNRFLRLTMISCNNGGGNVELGIGFTPGDVPVDQKLYDDMHCMKDKPDIWKPTSSYTGTSVELFVTHGNLLARGYITRGAHAIAHVEVFEMIEKILSPLSLPQRKHRIENGKSINSIESFKSSMKSKRFSCIVEIVNCLVDNLESRNKFYCNSENNDFLLSEILPLRRERFFIADDDYCKGALLIYERSGVEAMFSFDIVSTDLAFVVALKVRKLSTSYAAAFVQLPDDSDMNAKELEEFLDSHKWEKYFYRKLSDAKEGVQLIRMRNIRAEMEMADAEKSRLKIRIFAV